MKTVIKHISGAVSIMTVVSGTSDDAVEQWKTAHPGEYESHREMEDSAIPADRSQRHLWRDDSPDAVIDIAAEAVLTTEEFIADVTEAAQARLDAFAQTRNYDGILSACTYAASSVPAFAAEGQYCVNARDATWSTLYTVMAEVQAGTRPMPGSVADVMALLPALEWPA